jgi:hypothetical protein
MNKIKIMNLEIVSYEVAVDLKELGFNWNTDKVYAFVSTPKENETYRRLNHNDYETKIQLLPIDGWDDDPIYAPTQAEVCKWFRDVHDIFIDISKDNQNMFDVVIRWNNHWKPVGGNMGGTWHFYEQAELAGIKKAIEILKEKL